MEVQKNLLETIRNLFPKEFNMVEEMSKLLHLEKGAVYKRLSGETPMKIDEVCLLCRHFGISIDNIVFADSTFNIFSFQYQNFGSKTFVSFLNDYIHTFDSLRKGVNNELIVVCSQAPVYYFFDYPILARFSFEFFKYEALGFPTIEQPLSYFRPDAGEDAMLRELSRQYCEHPSIELVSRDFLGGHLQRIRLAVTMGMIEAAVARQLLDDTRSLVRDLDRAAEKGRKTNHYSQAPGAEVKILLNPNYAPSGNMFYYNTDGYEKIFLGLGFNNVLITADNRFCKYLSERIRMYQAFSINITVENAIDRKELMRYFFGEIDKMTDNIGAMKA